MNHRKRNGHARETNHTVDDLIETFLPREPVIVADRCSMYELSVQAIQGVLPRALLETRQTAGTLLDVSPKAEQAEPGGGAEARNLRRGAGRAENVPWTSGEFQPRREAKTNLEPRPSGSGCRTPLPDGRGSKDGAHGDARAEKPTPRSDGLATFIEQMSRGLCRRRCRHLLLTGSAGVGKTTLVRELARRAAVGELPALASRRFIRADCHNCLDDLGKLLRAPWGRTNIPLLRKLLNEPKIQVLGVLPRCDFDDLLAAESAILEICPRIDIPEPTEELALAIVQDATRRLEKEFQTQIDPKAVEKAVRLSGKFISNLYLPLKAIRILERACENAEYDRVAGTFRVPSYGRQDPVQPEPPWPPLTKGGREDVPAEAGTRAEDGTRDQPVGRCPPATIGVEEVIRVIAELSGVPVEILSGDTFECPGA